MLLIRAYRADMPGISFLVKVQATKKITNSTMLNTLNMIFKLKLNKFVDFLSYTLTVGKFHSYINSFICY